MASNYSTPLVSVLPYGGTYDGNHTNFIDLPTPSEYKMTSATLVDSARNASGVVVSQIIREGIRKIEMVWNYLTQAQFSLIAKAFESSAVGGNGHFMCYAYFYDTIRGEYVDSYTEFVGGIGSRRMFYVGDRVSDSAKIKLNNAGEIVGYQSVKLSLIEC